MEMRLGSPGSKRVELPVCPGDTSLDVDTDEALHILQPLRKYSVSLRVHLPGRHGAFGSENESPSGVLTLSRDESWIWDFCCQMSADSWRGAGCSGLSASTI